MSEVERTSAGLQIVIPGCERRTLPRSTTRVDEIGQGLLHFYKPPSLREKLETRADAPLRPSKGQKALPKGGVIRPIDMRQYNGVPAVGYYSLGSTKPNCSCRGCQPPTGACDLLIGAAAIATSTTI